MRSIFAKEFDRDTRLRNQADINACMILIWKHWVVTIQVFCLLVSISRLALMKNTDGNNHDIRQWHHFGSFTGTYLIVGGLRLQVTVWTSILRIIQWLIILSECYGNFIKMGVDGFRIDTSGHISRLTFCKQFIPQFAALGKQYEDKRLSKAPFFMYGEFCSRYSGVQYRGGDNLSPFYYIHGRLHRRLDIGSVWWQPVIQDTRENL